MQATRRPGGGARGRGVLVIAALAGSAACAVQVPPSGGPEDTTPPRVAATVPAADSTRVDVTSPVRLTFSEEMTRARVERSVSFQPAITLQSVRWEDRTLVIVPQGGLQRDTTYVVRVKPGYRDRRGVSSRAGYEFAFATGAALDTARVEGKVLFKREPSGRAVVRAFRVPRSEDFDPAAARPDREATTAPDGTYRLRYLPANGARFVLMAFEDANGNGLFDPPGEPAAVRADTVELTSAAPVRRGIDFAIIDPNEPAVVSGTVTNETGIDSLRVSVLAIPVSDTTRAPMYTLCDPRGAYELTRVPAGRYLLQAFLDLKADSACGVWDCADTLEAGRGREPCPEPCVVSADTLRVEPGQSVKAPPLVLRRREGP